MIEPKDLPPEVGVLGDGVPASVTPILTTSSSPTSQVLKPLGLEVPAGADLEAEAVALLAAGQVDVWDVLTHRFESRLIQAALSNTKGRRIEAAQKLGIGRNTITRKIQELGLE
jgi:two-component system nitrogen regulation response regulator GlnG